MFNQLGGGSSNPNKDLEVTSPPDDTVSALEFSPPSLQQTFLIAGSWDCRVSSLHVTRVTRSAKAAFRSCDKIILHN